MVFGHDAKTSHSLDLLFGIAMFGKKRGGSVLVRFVFTFDAIGKSFVYGRILFLCRYIFSKISMQLHSGFLQQREDLAICLSIEVAW